MTDTTAPISVRPHVEDHGALAVASYRPRGRLICASFLMLFIELALIRWTGSNNVYLEFLTNFVLLASFLGIGVGFLQAGAPRRWISVAPLALLSIVVFGLAFPVRFDRLTGHHQLSAAFGLGPLPEWLSLAIVFVLAAVVMGTIAHEVARLFSQFAPLEAYRLDILGSIAGIATFSTLAFLRLPPIAWGIVASAALIALLGRRMRWWQIAALAGVLGLLTLESLGAHDHWSPYYKITAIPNGRGAESLRLSANNLPHQTAYSVNRLQREQPFYFYPYRHANRRALDDVLLVGAGSGNDVAVALREGARHIDAVEIDPEIRHLGSIYHPDHPYQDPRVTVHINDGRAFLQQTGKHYDLILFALPDSLTLLGQSNLRLENFLFTSEAMRAARGHLKPGGTFAMYNYYEPFLLNRYAGTLATTYGSPPCVEVGNRFRDRRQAVLTSSAAGRTPNCATYWHGQKLAPATDDWPFPYLTSRHIPGFFLRWLAAIAIASFLVVRLAAGPLRPLLKYLDLALMGGAFLLLETKNVVQFALLFGTTWFVNSLVFAGVLLSVLGAIEVASRFRLPRPPVLYAALAVALGIAWAVPPETLLSLSPAPRFVAATALAFAPIFLANLIFSQRFRDTASSTTAFGANLLGAMLGGALEYLALISGYRFLLVVIAGLYGLALIAGRSRLAAVH